MTFSAPTAEQQIAFLHDLQRILEEGDFSVATRQVRDQVDAVYQHVGQSRSRHAEREVKTTGTKLRRDARTHRLDVEYSIRCQG
jgi:hypothetical protein